MLREFVKIGGQPLGLLWQQEPVPQSLAVSRAYLRKLNL